VSSAHVPTLYSEFNALPVRPTLIHEQQLLILAHKIIHHSESVPEIFIDYNDSVHIVITPGLKMICIFLEFLLDTDLDV